MLEAAGDDASAQIENAFLMAYSRRPDSTETDTALTFLDTQSRLIAERAARGEELALPEAELGGLSEAQGAALVDLCHTLFNSNEFVYRD